MSAGNSDDRISGRLKRQLSAATALTVDFIAYIIVRLLVAVIQTLPYDMGDSVCRALATLAAGAAENPPSGDRGEPAASFPRFGRTIAQASYFCDVASFVVDGFAKSHGLCVGCIFRIGINGWYSATTERCFDHLLSDRPVVMVTGHFGNFEIGGYVSGLMGFNSLTIARRLDNPFLHRWVERFRGAKGQYMVDKHGCAPEVDRHLKQGGLLSLLADQHAGPKGCWVDFMGVPASCHKALALFTLSSNAPMVIGSTRRIDGQPMRFELACTGVADPENDHQGVCTSMTALTQWYNQRLALAINQSLEQYWWLHRRWREPPPRVRQTVEPRSVA